MWPSHLVDPLAVSVKRERRPSTIMLGTPEMRSSTVFLSNCFNVALRNANIVEI